MKKQITAIILNLSLVIILSAGVVGCDLSDASGFDPIILMRNPDSGSIGLANDDSTIITLAMPPLSEVPTISNISIPNAPGTLVKRTEKALIDYSNSSDGYVMIRFLRNTSKQLRVQVTTPASVTYTYTLKQDASFEVYPLSGGDGSYSVRVFEQIEGSRYSVAGSATVNVRLTDEFAPFLRANQYVNFTPQSNTVAKAAELVEETDAFFDKVASIYNFVITNLSYDTQLARTVQSGYLPVLDTVLERGKGICFDYAALMTAMLRSQGLPTKLVVGYAGTAYHAWINVYSEETGWIESIIFFDGSKWTLMDPTFASSRSAAAQRFIGDGANYKAMFLY